MIKLNKKGFTLIELLVVIAIIALLSTIAIVSLGNARQKARDAKRIADIKQMQTALELEYTNTGNGYKVNETPTIIDAIGTSMTTVPLAPNPADTGNGVCTTKNNSYLYVSTSADGSALCTTAPCEGFMLQFCTYEATGTINAGLHCATPGGISNAACPSPFVQPK
ncbi:hypothetical protein CVV26_01270 [Candidatus Kuenenbacteria bacterium HGW-Kuenenbacteria-1]|uniref:Type II secretion system protein GspG C-terminal domain-containing protein n=1 Tax=Candidatus Kuenenbacteria bacterium HGW-Kuenenbacteria-1 TaxID=2013812 RepID=A0A2N1UNQ3_9BACT|nr:MAG: hypothetical protein CVV26_01270 [Candidatus Kuenenbacteria bacterium HGW-Kuenenbacteria-1]